ncbi:MAG: stage II sporulation protein R [Eubacteriales bacterium]|nr:stage II sporulation protein R [Eubacterium sp.]MDD7179552.1 stage II sporulation protein R [Eubacterium sp.]MDY5494296.1 stage II sporulation protein R [Eubacteriales bacterium]
MKFITIFAAFILCLCMICSFIPSQSDMQIYTDTVRLHVIAESDDSADQLIKLSVRNEVVEYLSELSENAQSAEETIKIINDNIDDIRRVADRALEKLGSDAKAEVVLSNEYYPTRSCENVRLPAGTYTSLKIKIGKAQGHNWWCVLYPQLSRGSASVDDTLIRTGFSSDQIEILTGSEKIKYKLRFKILEIFG